MCRKTAESSAFADLRGSEQDGASCKHGGLPGAIAEPEGNVLSHAAFMERFGLIAKTGTCGIELVFLVRGVGFEPTNPFGTGS